MKDALIYHVASGQAFFSGVALVQLALMLSLRPMSRWASFGRRVGACGGLALIAASATPLPAWLWVAAVGVTVFWIGVEGSAGAGLRRLQPWLRGAVLGLWWLGVALEWPYHRMPAIPRLGDPPLYVVGDSVSAGMGGERETWPRRLGRLHGVVIHDLSLAGATVGSARQQAARVREPRSLVLAEIGGNDVLAGTTALEFERGLDALLAHLRSDGRPVVLLELPLPPFFNRYGAIQRRLARRHGAILVPKRVLLGVLTRSGATVDSIHLSRAGHGLMAEAMWTVLRPAYRRESPSD
jgi:acyl-CoA thioesterase-1